MPEYVYRPAQEAGRRWGNAHKGASILHIGEAADYYVMKRRLSGEKKDLAWNSFVTAAVRASKRP